MKELNELIKECKDGVSELADLKEKEAKLRTDLKETLVKNSQLFRDSTSDYVALIKNLAEFTQCSVRAHKLYEHKLVADRGYYIEIRASDYAQCIQIVLRQEGVGTLDYCSWENIHAFGDNKLEDWAFFFGSEDSVSKVVKCFEEYVADVLNIYLREVISRDISDFREKIENLKSALSEAHTVEEKEDGTVEIRLGGKTYVGKVVEE